MYVFTNLNCRPRYNTASLVAEKLIMLMKLRFMRMSTEPINIKTMAMTTPKGTVREPRNITISTMIPEIIVATMGGRTCGDSPSSRGRLVRRAHPYIC